MPEPDEENKPRSEYESMVVCAGRVVLMQLQMLLLTHLHPLDEKIGFGHKLGLPYDDVSLNTALRSCHLAPNSPNDIQLPLFKTE